MKDKLKTVHFGPEELKDKAAINKALLKAVKIKGTAVVIKPDGSISYKDPSKAGQYHEEKIR